METNVLYSFSAQHPATHTIETTSMPGVNVSGIARRFTVVSLICLCLTAQARGQIFKIDDIRYTVTHYKMEDNEKDSHKIAVVSDGHYTDRIIDIPGQERYDGVMYDVTGIGSRAFYNCDSITSITIPKSITYIGEWAFWGCTKLSSVEVEWLTPPAAGITPNLGFDYEKSTLIVPFGAKERYQDATVVWSLFKTIKETDN